MNIIEYAKNVCIFNRISPVVLFRVETFHAIDLKFQSISIHAEKIDEDTLFKWLLLFLKYRWTYHIFLPSRKIQCKMMEKLFFASQKWIAIETRKSIAFNVSFIKFLRRNINKTYIYGQMDLKFQ